MVHIVLISRHTSTRVWERKPQNSWKCSTEPDQKSKTKRRRPLRKSILQCAFVLFWCSHKLARSVVRICILLVSLFGELYYICLYLCLESYSILLVSLFGEIVYCICLSFHRFTWKSQYIACLSFHRSDWESGCIVFIAFFFYRFKWKSGCISCISFFIFNLREWMFCSLFIDSIGRVIVFLVSLFHRFSWREWMYCSLFIELIGRAGVFFNLF